MELVKINYDNLNSREKENYNYHKIASALADYGFDCMRLNNDWEGADFIAVHNDGEQMLKVQLKGRLSFNKKYIGKDIWIAFVYKGEIRMYNHDELLYKHPKEFFDTESWKRGAASSPTVPSKWEDFILKL